MDTHAKYTDTDTDTDTDIDTDIDIYTLSLSHTYTKYTHHDRYTGFKFVALEYTL